MSVPFKKTPMIAALALATASSVASAQLVLEEVIVTAQKRAESLQDVPISVTALQGDKCQYFLQSLPQIRQGWANLQPRRSDARAFAI